METHQRAMLLKTTSKKHLSASIQNTISLIIKAVREGQGHEQAENIAKEIRELIEATETEEELLMSLKKKYPTMI